jgi:hypothetical protein
MRRKKSSWLRDIAVSLAICGASAGPAQGQSCGPPCQTANPPSSGTWTLAGSPYCITSDFLIGDLTIEPGVCVLVDGPCKIEVLFRLRALGTAAQPITFTSQDPQERWKGLEFNNAGTGSELNYCTISRSDNSGVRITITSSGVEPPLLRRCTIEANTSVAPGGGIRALLLPGNPYPVLEDCRILNNAAASAQHQRAGGLYLSGSAKLTGCAFDGNLCVGTTSACSNASALGSSMYCDGDGTVIVNSCVFSGGETHSSAPIGCGPGISRAAIFVAEGVSLQLENSIIACNSVTVGFSSIASTGGIWVEGGTVSILNCAIARNTSYGVFNDGGTVDVRNSILYDNNQLTAPPNPTYGAQYGGDIPTFNYCDVRLVPGAPPLPGEGNIDVNPVFKGLGCDACQLMIQPVSLNLVDHGDPALVDACRLSYGGDRSDIGAHGGPGNCHWFCYPDCDSDQACSLTVADFGCFQTKFVSGHMYADCNGDGVLTVADFGCFQTMFVVGCP